ncbi:MAG: glycosyltransferase family 39 protein [Planctomycetes bacterium]|nr:glycosyltransferase family 39 protein [Planctomycetota bacterium]
MNLARLSMLAWLAWTAAGLGWLVVLVLRVGYPFHLEWLESHVFCQALRFAQGFPLYEDPARGLPAHPYGPLYYLVCGGLLRVLEPSLLACRIVSQLATIGVAATAWALARKSGASARSAWLAPLAWLAFFPACGAWYDLARVDLLGLALWFAGVLCVRDAEQNDRRWWSAIALFSLAALAKQSCLPLACWSWVVRSRAREWRSSLLGAAATAFVTLGIYFLIDRALDGRLFYYAWQLPGSHPQDWAHAALLFCLPALPLALVGVAVALVIRGRREELALLFHWIGAALLCSWTITKQGAFLNHYLPLAALAAVLVPLGVDALREVELARVRRAMAGSVLLLAAVLSLGASSFREQVPTEADRAAGEQWLAWLRKSEVEVRLPAFTYLPVLAGRPVRVHEMAAVEVLDDWSRRLAAQRGIAATAEHMAQQPDLESLLRGEPTAFVLADDGTGGTGLSFFAPLLLAPGAARFVESWSYPDPAAFRAKTGNPVRPASLWVAPANAAIALPPMRSPE